MGSWISPTSHCSLCLFDASKILVVEVPGLLASIFIRRVLEAGEVAVFVVLSAKLFDALAVVNRALLGLHDLVEYGSACAVLEQYDCNVTLIAVPSCEFHHLIS